MTYDNTNSGLMYRNDDKQQDSHPDFKGSINVEGAEYWLSAWVKEGKEGGKFEGRKFFSIALKPKDASKYAGNRTGSTTQGKSNQGAPGVSGSGFDDMDDGIPF